MALSPQSENGVRSRILKQAEEMIDQHILMGTNVKCVQILRCVLPRDLTKEDWNILAPKYQKAGWKTTEFLNEWIELKV